MVLGIPVSVDQVIYSPTHLNTLNLNDEYIELNELN